MHKLTDAERDCLKQVATFTRPDLARDCATAERLAHRGYLVPKPVAWCNYPLVSLSAKGAKAVRP